jgi:hypothetical protein
MPLFDFHRLTTDCRTHSPTHDIKFYSMLPIRIKYLSRTERFYRAGVTLIFSSIHVDARESRMIFAFDFEPSTRFYDDCATK